MDKNHLIIRQEKLISFLRNKRGILLSPHYDDVALSMGGWITKWGHICSCLVLNVFTRTQWALGLENEKEIDWSSITIRRKEEDRRFCRSWDLESSDMGLPDSSCRNFDAVTELTTELDQDFYKEIREKLLEIISEYVPEFLFFPMGIGNHIDHYMLYHFSQSEKNDNMLFIYYEDLPYGCKYQETELLELIKSRVDSAEPVYFDIGDVLDQKQKNLEIYESQFLKADIVEVLKYSEKVDPRGSFERFWLSGNRELA